MAVERLELTQLPTFPDGSTQWIDRQTSPSAKEADLYERESIQAQREQRGVEVAYALIHALVKGWHVLDNDGHELTSHRREDVEHLGARTLSVISDDLEAIMGGIRPDKAAQSVTAMIRMLSFGMSDQDAATARRIADEWAELNGIGGPNAASRVE